jgi:threonine dehydrogenase-like Zn-dependent dehydrogenase
MRAAVITGPGAIGITEQPTPKARGDVVVVRILVAPLCTEFKQRRAGQPGDRLGHEAAGVVVDPGSSTLVSEGDRVVVMPQYACGRCWLCVRGEHIHCRSQRDVLAETGSESGLGTIAEYVLKPDYLLLKVPDDIPLEHAAMACCGFGPTFTAHHRLGTSVLDTTVVSGCGAVGLGAVLQGATRGARVIALETQSYRSELARKLGAAEVLDPLHDDVGEVVRAMTDGRGADGGVETSGAPPAAGTLAGSIRVRGGLALVAWTSEVTFPTPIPAGLDIYACWHWNHALHLAGMWAMIRAAGAGIDAMITHRLALDEVADAMDLQDSGDCGKIILYPFGAEAVTY